MNPDPFFTILTASLNNDKTLKKTLLSVKNQTFEDLEHIVVDGDSVDGTKEILRNLAGSYHLTWISEPDRGIAHALNKGLRLARGTYVLVIHADDRFLEKSILAAVYPILKTERPDIGAFPIILEPPFGDRKLLRPKNLISWHHFKTVFLHQGAFVHRRVFEQIGGFDEQFSIAFDYDFFYRALATGARVRFAGQPVTLMGGAGLSHRESLVRKRILEEFSVQKKNERIVPWKMLQVLFRCAYFPMKVHLTPLLKGRGSTKNGSA